MAGRPLRRWRKIHTAVWLIGLAILALKGWWWPGILVLAAISALVEAALPREPRPSTGNQVEKDYQSGGQASFPPAKTAAAAPSAPVAARPRLELLPTNCPRCGAPLHGVDVKWTSDCSADCPFCGSHLPLKAE